MQPYRNLSGESGVTAYEIGSDYISVQFINGRVYRYTYATAGRSNIEKMKLLAAAGKGLSTYISQYAHNAYES